MKRPGTSKSTILLLTWFGMGMLLILFILVAVHPVLSDDHKELKQHSKDVYEHAFEGEDHGNETTGEIAAWLFGLANLPVALSIILKTLVKVIPPKLNLIDPIKTFNRQQKKYLMTFHYWLNPFALGVALIHLSLSTCGSTSFPEWGLGLLLITVLLGLAMKFKLSPSSMRRTVFKLHTSSIVFIAAISILLIGHTIAD